MGTRTLELCDNFLTILQEDTNFEEKKKSLISFSGEIAEVAEKKQALDIALRSYLSEVLWKHYSNKSTSFDDCGALGVVALALDLREYEEIGSYALPFFLLDDLVESSTTKDCHHIFNFLEKNRENLRQNEHRFNEKVRDLSGEVLTCKLVVVKMCNELMRRLSKTKDTLLRGKVHLFLTYMMSLQEKSALPMYLESSGDVIDFESEEYFAEEQEKQKALEDEINKELQNAHPEANLTHNDAPIDYHFYRALWGVQKYFKQPSLVFGTQGWLDFNEDLSRVLKAFSSRALYSEDVAKEKEQKKKLKQMAGLEVEKEGAPLPMDVDEDELESSEEHFFCPKFLTSSTLVSLQLNDPSFRRHVLVQIIFFCHYLRDPLFEPRHLEHPQLQILTSFKDEALKLAAATGPDAATFAKLIHKLLARESVFEKWRHSRYPSFEKNPVTEFPLMRKKAGPASAPATPTTPPPQHNFGHPQLNRLWNQYSSREDGLDELYVPEAATVLQGVVDELDPDCGIEEEFWRSRDEGFIWKALRVISRQHREAFQEVSSFEEMVLYLKKKLGMKSMAEQEKEEEANNAVEDENMGGENEEKVKEEVQHPTHEEKEEIKENPEQGGKEKVEEKEETVEKVKEETKEEEETVEKAKEEKKEEEGEKEEEATPTKEQTTPEPPTPRGGKRGQKAEEKPPRKRGRPATRSKTSPTTAKRQK